MGRSFTERLISGACHLIALAGILHLAINLIGFPLFPRSTILWLVPNTAIAIIALKWSRFVYSHTVQALGFQLCGMALALVPWVIRMLNKFGLLGERWYYTGWQGSAATPAWSLMTIIVGLSSVFLFVLSTEASNKGFTGERFQYPGIGKLAARITK